MAISPGSLLLLNSFSVAPLAEATTGGLRLRGNSQAIDIAGQLNADQQRQEVEKLNRSPMLVAFDAKERFVETILHVRNALDVFL